jgi:hypothetical protein
MTIFVSLGKDCSVGWNIKQLIGQKYMPFDFLRISDVEWVLDWIMHGMDFEEFFKGLEFSRESDKFGEKSRIHKTPNLGFFHDFYPGVTLEDVREKYKRRIDRLKKIFTEPQMEYIHFVRNGSEPKNLKKFKAFLKAREIPYKFTIINWKDNKDWRIPDKPWGDVFELTHYRNFVEQSTDAKVDTTLWRPELIEEFERIRGNPGNYKMYVSDNGVMVAQINPYQITHHYTRLFPYKEIKIKVSPGGFAQSNISIANELYTFVANMVKGKELVTIYGRNSHHYLSFIEDLVKECRGYNPCPICVKDSNNTVILSKNPDLEGFGIISPGRQGLKFEVKLKEYLYISCNDSTAMRDLKGKNYTKIREFNLFPGTGFTEQVFLI